MRQSTDYTSATEGDAKARYQAQTHWYHTVLASSRGAKQGYKDHLGAVILYNNLLSYIKI